MSDILSACAPCATPPPMPSPAMLHTLRAGMLARIKRDEHQLAMLRCSPGQTSPAALALRRRIDITRADLAELGGAP